MLGLIPPDRQFYVSDVQTMPDGNYSYRVTYQFLKIEIVTASRTTEMIPGERLVIETTGQMNGLTIWQLADDDGGTRVTLRAEYEDTPGPMSSVTSRFARRTVVNTLTHIAVSLKKIL